MNTPPIDTTFVLAKDAAMILPKLRFINATSIDAGRSTTSSSSSSASGLSTTKERPLKSKPTARPKPGIGSLNASPEGDASQIDLNGDLNNNAVQSQETLSSSSTLGVEPTTVSSASSQSSSSAEQSNLPRTTEADPTTSIETTSTASITSQIQIPTSDVESAASKTTIPTSTALSTAVPSLPTSAIALASSSTVVSIPSSSTVPPVVVVPASSSAPAPAPVATEEIATSSQPATPSPAAPTTASAQPSEVQSASLAVPSSTVASQSVETPVPQQAAPSSSSSESLAKTTSSVVGAALPQSTSKTTPAEPIPTEPTKTSSTQPQLSQSSSEFVGNSQSIESKTTAAQATASATALTQSTFLESTSSTAAPTSTTKTAVAQSALSQSTSSAVFSVPTTGSNSNGTQSNAPQSLIATTNSTMMAEVIAPTAVAVIVVSFIVYLLMRYRRKRGSLHGFRAHSAQSIRNVTNNVTGSLASSLSLPIPVRNIRRKRKDVDPEMSEGLVSRPRFMSPVSRARNIKKMEKRESLYAQRREIGRRLSMAPWLSTTPHPHISTNRAAAPSPARPSRGHSPTSSSSLSIRIPPMDELPPLSFAIDEKTHPTHQKTDSVASSYTSEYSSSSSSTESAIIPATVNPTQPAGVQDHYGHHHSPLLPPPGVTAGSRPISKARSSINSTVSCTTCSSPFTFGHFADSAPPMPEVPEAYLKPPGVVLDRARIDTDAANGGVETAGQTAAWIDKL